MIAYSDPGKIKINDNTVVVIGKFDGVHLGHRYLFDQAIKIGREKNYQVVAFTFDRNISGKGMLTTNCEREKLLRDLGVDILVEYPFKDIKNLDCKSFISDILVKKLKAKYIVAGSDCGFGKNRSGNANTLKEMSLQYDYETLILDKCMLNDVVVSSTHIRELIAVGDIQEANRFLGYPYYIYEEVIKGNQLGRTWDFPTINMLCDERKILPPLGVYASYVIIDGIKYYSVTDIGRKPTVDSLNEVITVETYIFDFSRELYGSRVDLFLQLFIRPEMKFENFNMLKKQIEKDVIAVKDFFKVH